MKSVLAVCALAVGWLVAARAPAFGGPVPIGQSTMGFLAVSSEPSGANIFIDDADVRQKTPQAHLPVAAGHHRLTLVTSDGSRKLTVGFTVEAGQTKKLTLYLAK